MTTFRNYLSIENIGGARWHPEKNEIVFVYDAPGSYQVHKGEIISSAMLWPKRLTNDENRCTNPRFLSDGTIIFSTDEGGNENFQICQINQKNEITRVSKDLDAKYNIFSSTENYLFYASNSEDKAKLKLYRHKLPLLENEPELIFEPGDKGIPQVSAISNDETQLVVTLGYSNVSSDLLLVNLEDKSVTNLTEELNKEGEPNWSAIRFIDNGILVATDYRSDFNRYAYLSLNGEFSTYEKLENDFKLDFGQATHKKEDEYTYFSVNNQGYSEVYKAIFTSNEIKNLEKIALPRNAVLLSGDARAFTNSMSLNHDHSLLAITCSGGNYPSNIYIIDTNTQKSWRVTDVNTPELNEENFVDASLHKFNSFDSLEVPYFRYMPNGNKPSNGWPSLIIIHGGPEAQITPSFSGIVQYYLSEGFAVITPNIRGSAGYGRTYMDLDNKEKRLDSIKDIAELANHLKSNDNDLDGDKLIIYGGSYGGFAVLSSLTEHPTLWKAGVDIVGISSFTTFLKNTAPWRRQVREPEYGSLEHDYDILESISPINKIDEIIAPLFIIQGDNDERVPLSESIQMYEKLKAKGLNVELLRFADEGHGLAKLKNKLVAYPRVVEWLKEIILD